MMAQLHYVNPSVLVKLVYSKPDNDYFVLISVSCHPKNRMISIPISTGA